MTGHSALQLLLLWLRWRIIPHDLSRRVLFRRYLDEAPDATRASCT